jgi:hypothetical protein
MNNAISLFTDLWGQLGRAPVALIICVTAMVIGLALKRQTWFRNTLIPFVVMLWCSVGYWLLGDASHITSVAAGWRQKLVLAFYGIILGFVTWAAHAFLLKKAEKFLPDGFFPPGTFDTATITKADVPPGTKTIKEP